MSVPAGNGGAEVTDSYLAARFRLHLVQRRLITSDRVTDGTVAIIRLHGKRGTEAQAVRHGNRDITGLRFKAELIRHDQFNHNLVTNTVTGLGWRRSKDAPGNGHVGTVIKHGNGTGIYQVLPGKYQLRGDAP